MNTEIFKAYDIRGKVGTELNEEVCRVIGRAVAQWLPTEGPVAVGHDMRPDSASLAAALIDGLRLQGRDVWDIGQVATDMIYYAVGYNNLAGGAVVTASHNPGEYNGIKLCREQAQPISIETGLADIRDAAAKGEFTPADQKGGLVHKDIDEGWITHVLGFIDVAKLTPLKLAVDAGNGMMGKVFPTLEPHVPWKITEMYFELDGTFPNHEANPLKFETLADMIKVIRDNQLDGGIAFDGDGDRAFLVDETGEVLTGGVMSAMMSEYFLKQFPGSNIVYDARNSRTVIDVIKASGGKPVLSRVGHSFIKQAMREADAPFGGEASGHFFFRDNWSADSGIIGAVIGLYVATLSGKKLSELRETYTHYAAIPETNFTVTDKDAVINRLAQEFTDAQQDRFDGLTVTLPDGWFNVRPSNTEPLLRLNAEMHDQAALDALVGRIKALISA